MSQPPPHLLPLGDYKPSDQWATHVNAIFYGIQGPGIHNHFQTYVSLDHRLAHALADEYFQNFGEDPGTTRFIHEWGVGNGNLAACFLSRLKEIDTENRVYPNIRYLLCDYSEEILKGVRNNPRLQAHQGTFSTVRVDAESLNCFKPGRAHKIISNEIWDDLATKVLLKHDGLLFEEYLQPYLDPALIPMPEEEFLAHFNDRDLEVLKSCPPFLQAIHWERDYQKVDISDWPFSDTLEAHLKGIEEGIPTPVNTGAFETLKRAKIQLAEDNLGYTGFDYGMFSFRELNAHGRPYFNLYGGQYTFMVNFELLEAVGKSLGFQNIEKQLQHDYVGRHLEDKVVSVLELVQSHPQAPEMPPWDQDVLMLRTLHALNNQYKNPYPHKMEYPMMEGTPKKQRKLIKQLQKTLSATGVPDTVAYVTWSEVISSSKKLRQLGYREKDLQNALSFPNQPIAFSRIQFK